MLSFVVILGLFFVPPKDWKKVDSEHLPASVKSGYLCKGEKGFCPSLNLAVEKVKSTQEQYIKSVRKIHELNPQNRWRNLGSFQTTEGDAILTEIDTKNKLGDVRLLQLILVKEGYAYILTASALKEEFGKHCKEFQQSFKTFQIKPESFIVDASN